MKTTAGKSIQAEPNKGPNTANAADTKPSATPEKVPASFPPRAVQTARHWKLLLILLAVVAFFILALLLSDTFLSVFS